MFVGDVPIDAEILNSPSVVVIFALFSMALQRCILTLLSALLSCGLVSDAADITGRVHVRSTTPSDASGSSVSLTEPPRVVLNGGEFQTYARKDGSFTFLSVPPGVYLMEIFQKDAAYSQYKINVPAGSESVDGSGIQVVEYKYPGAPKLQAKHPIEALPVAPAIYFDERPRFNIWSLLGNQMVRVTCH